MPKARTSDGVVTFPNMAAGIQLRIPDRCTQEVLRFLDEITFS